MPFVETGIIILIALAVIDLANHFFDRFSSSSCTNQDGEGCSFKMKKIKETE